METTRKEIAWWHTKTLEEKEKLKLKYSFSTEVWFTSGDIDFIYNKELKLMHI